MRIPAFIAAVAMALLLVAHSPAVPATPAFINSVEALSTPIIHEGVWDEKTGTHITYASFDTICTAFSINERAKLWMTDHHCVEQPGTYYIRGEPVTIVTMNVKQDIAILKTIRASAKGIPLAAKDIVVGDAISMYGYPLSLGFPLLNTGIVSATNIMTPDPGLVYSGPYNIFQMVGANGNSGSPIVNEDEELVGIEQWGWERGRFTPMLGGATLTTLRQFARWFE